MAMLVSIGCIEVGVGQANERLKEPTGTREHLRAAETLTVNTYYTLLCNK